MVFGFVAVSFNYHFPDTVFLFLLNSSGAIALFVWLVICFSQLRMRKIIQRESPEKLVVRMWLYPYLTWATIALIVFVLGYMLTDTEPTGGETGAAVARGGGGGADRRGGQGAAARPARGRGRLTGRENTREQTGGAGAVRGSRPSCRPSPYGSAVRRAAQRRASRQAAGSAPIASAALSASPIRNGVSPAAIAAEADMPVARAR